MSSSEQNTTRTVEADEYRIRLYEPGDREDFLSLFELVFDHEQTDAWFDWKYVENPYTDHVPMFVAEYDGEVVGARPYLAFEMQTGDRTLLGLQTCDTMVHPDHRRRGLFSRMTARSFDYYSSFADPVLKFSIPNALSRPGYLNLGCRVVSELPTRYRIQNLDGLIGDGTFGRAASIAQPLATVHNRARDRLSVPTVDADIDVVRHEDVPARQLSTLYESAVPSRIHATRGEEFYRWRFTNPEWTYRTYTAREGETPVAGVVTGTKRDESGVHVQLTEVVPLVGDGNRRDALAVLLGRILDDAADADVISVSGPAIETDLLSAFGFYPDDSLPLSVVSTPTVLITRVLDGRIEDRWLLDGHDLLDVSSWHLSYSEHNTS